MDAIALTERRKLNEEVERTFINATFYIRRFHKFQQTNRDENLLLLYEGFYSEFDLLVMLTCNLQQLQVEKAKTVITKAQDWLDKLSITDDDKKIETRFISGITIFKEYSKVLYDEGVIAMPSGSGGR